MHAPQGNSSPLLFIHFNIWYQKSDKKRAKKKKRAIFLSDVTFTLHLRETEKRRCVEMNFNDELLTMAVGFFISVAGPEFPLLVWA